MLELNDSIGFMLREQMQNFIVREQLVWDFIHETSEPMQRLGNRGSHSLIREDRRAKGMFYDLGEDYKLGMFVEDNELRFVLMNHDYDTLQTASSTLYETIDRTHFAVVLKEAAFDKFGSAVDTMSVASDDDRGNAVMKLMMLNNTEKEREAW